MANETTMSLVEEIIPTEDIDLFVSRFEYVPPVSQLIAWLRPSPLGTIPVRFPRWNQLDQGAGVPAGTKAEADDFDRVVIDTDEGSLTPGLVGFELALTEEAQRGAQISGGLPAAVLIEGIAALLDRMDKDFHSGSTSATNTVGGVSEYFSHDRFAAASAAYRALKLRSALGHACVLHVDAMRDLVESMSGSTSMFQASNLMQNMIGPEQGAKGIFHGFELFESGNVAAESSGWSNYMTPIGPTNSGMAIAMTETPRVEATAGFGTRDAQGARSRVDVYVISAWYAAGLVNPRRVLEVLSRT